MIDVTGYPSPEAATADAVYAVGDIHGRLDLLKRMEAAIAEDTRASAAMAPVICYLGDYIDRGPASAQVLEHLSMPAADQPERVFLKGNHEDRMLAFLDDPAAHGARWMRFGGDALLTSYGLPAPAGTSDPDWAALRDALLAALPATHLGFLRGLRLAFVWRDYLFVHAGVDPGRPLDAQRTEDLLWIREPFLKSDRDYGRRVIHGHSVSERPVFRANRIGIDTGAYATGTLTCLVLGQGAPRLLEAVVA